VVFHIWQPDVSERRLTLSPVSVAAIVVPGVVALLISAVPTFVLSQGLTGATQLLK
jgi:hypothetical protein